MVTYHAEGIMSVMLDLLFVSAQLCRMSAPLCQIYPEHETLGMLAALNKCSHQLNFLWLFACILVYLVDPTVDKNSVFLNSPLEQNTKQLCSYSVAACATKALAQSCLSRSGHMASVQQMLLCTCTTGKFILIDRWGTQDVYLNVIRGIYLSNNCTFFIFAPAQ